MPNEYSPAKTQMPSETADQKTPVTRIQPPPGPGQVGMDAFNEMHQNTRHIATQTDRIAAHLLEGQTMARKDAARTLIAQVAQIARNQALIISLVEEIHQRLVPPGQATQGHGPQNP